MNKKKKNILIVGSISVIFFILMLIKQAKEKEEANTKNMFTSKEDYLKTLLPFAKEIQNKYGIPYLFLLAQTAIETGFGKHTPGFNFGGIKAKPGQDFNLLWTTEHVSDVSKFPNRDKSKDKPLPNGKTSIRIQAKFAKYPNIETGLKEYIKILLLDRYKAAFNYSDPKLFAAEIKKGGYATDINYVAKLSKMIDEIKNTLNT